MSITQAELKGYLSANMPEDDVSASGGAILATGKFELTNPAAADRLSIQSTAADTRTVTITGRNAAGAIIAEGIVANGTNWVNGALDFERILKITTSSDPATTITVAKYAAGAHTPPLATIEPLITSVRGLFYASASEAGAMNRYEKVFLKNTNATLTLTSAAIMLTGDPAAKITVGCAPSVDDSATTPDGNRKDTNSIPVGVTFVDDNVSQSVPGGSIAAASAIGVWVKQALGAADAAFKNTWTIQLSGTTT